MRAAPEKERTPARPGSHEWPGAAQVARFDPRVPFAFTLQSATVRERPRWPARIVCEVDGSQEARDAVAAAIALCRERHADLELVGVVPAARNPGRPRPATGSSERSKPR